MHTSKQRPGNQMLGQKGEQLAAEFLKQAGHTILYRNYRFKRSELDIVSLEKDTLVISEVKSMQAAPLGEAEFRVNAAKQRQIILGAYGFLSQFSEYEGYPVRFDILIINFSEYPAKVTWHQEAFWDQRGWG